MSSRGTILLLALGSLAAAAAGCALWTEPPSEARPLPAARMSPDSVALEITFVQLPPDAAEFDSAFWPEVDEQTLSAEMRRRFTANGLRCGLLGSQLPPALRKLLDAAQRDPAGGEAMLPLEDAAGVQQRVLHSRAGKRGEIIVSSTHEKMVLLTRDDGETRGKTYPQAQGLFAVKTFPQGDGRARLELTPELYYGQARTRYVPGQEGAFQLETSRELEVFERLRLEHVLAPGQTLVIASQGDLGLGGRFFTEKTTGGLRRKLLLVRLSQTQLDDLFAPEQTRELLNPTAD